MYIRAFMSMCGYMQVYVYRCRWRGGGAKWDGEEKLSFSITLVSDCGVKLDRRS